MTSVDKAAIAWTIAIVIVGAGIAAAGGHFIAAPSSSPVMTEETSIEKETAPEPEPEPVVTSESEVVLSEDLGMDASTPMEEEPAPAAAGPQTVTVVPTEGSGTGDDCGDTDSCWEPNTVTINAGDTVKWINSDISPHTVASGADLTADDVGQLFDSDFMGSDAEFSHTFNDPGEYDYFCFIHPWMKGQVIVN